MPRKIRRLHRGTEMQIAELPFSRVFEEIYSDLDPNATVQYRFQRSALQALQEAAEAFVCFMFAGKISTSIL